MDLQQGDWVRTKKGEVDKVVHISRLTFFVALPVDGIEDRIDAFLESDLERVKRPN
jgi:hypothetical protein